jgi:hypothetical protein
MYGQCETRVGNFIAGWEPAQNRQSGDPRQRGNDFGFKTGQPLEEHRQQVTTYAGALYEMGYRPIRKFLIYIDDQVEVQEVC